MTAAVRAILEQVERLSPEEREELGQELLGEVHLHPAWGPELERRMAEMDERAARGEPVGRDAFEVIDEIECELLDR